VTSERQDEELAGGHRRMVVVLAGLVLASLAAGLLVFGLNGEEPPRAAAGSGCAVHRLAYTVTDSADAFAEQKRFELSQVAVTAPGLYRGPVAEVPTLHAASHGSVVVFHRGVLGAGAAADLQALHVRAARTKAPVVIAPREQDDAHVAISNGYELRCGGASPRETAEVVRFAARAYASLTPPAAPGRGAVVTRASVR
jgi:hypothetical protein